MNIFPLSEKNCPIESAKQLCGRHCSRMPLETAGMIAFAFPEGETSIKNERKNRHFIHPASIFVRKTKENLEWTILHGLAQCEEYSRRYKRRHASQDFIEWSSENYSSLTFEESGLTDFARCFSEFKEDLDATEPNTVAAYRKFYWLDKKGFAKWPSKKEIPEWWPEISDSYVDPSFKDGVYTKR
jgi:hypothetical protein